FAIEALDSKHPAHDYFADRERRDVTNALNINWSVPDGANVEHVLQAGLSMMDGIQSALVAALPVAISTPCGSTARMCCSPPLMGRIPLTLP
ncbi:MAG: hypothetical protein ACLTB3_00005, partial [Bifidobacterium scardovii]